MTKEGKTPFGTPIGGSAVGEEGLGRFGDPERKTSYFSPSGNEVGKVASSDLSNLKIASPEVRIANVQSYTGSGPKPYVPDAIDRIIKDTKFPSTTYTDSSGDVYTKKPYTESSPGMKFYNVPDAQLIRKKGDDPNFSQQYSTASDRENFLKERNAYLKDQGRPTPPDPNKMKTIEGPMDAVKSLFGFRRDYQDAQTKDYKTKIDQNESYNYKMYRKDMRDKVFSESSYGEDVERGTIGKPGYYYKDFQKPGVYRSEEDVKSYIKDRGAFMTNMPSNFEGGVSGRGEKSDDLSSMYRSTAGDEKTRLQKLKEAQENRNVFQKVGDAVGNVFNKLTGTEAAAAGTLQSQGINTSATTNLSQRTADNSSIQKARDAVERSVRRQTGMSSNPGSQRQTGVGKSAGDLSRHKTGRSTSKGGISRSTSRGQGGGTSSRSRGGVSRGGSRSNTGSKSSARGARGSAGSRSRGGTGSGRTSTSRTASKASRRRTGRSRTRCDIRIKINISPLINSNLVKDDLAKLAYFVQEIKK